MVMQLLWEGIRPSWQFLDKYEVPMPRCVYMTFKLHVHDVFDKMYVMDMACQIRYLFKFFIKGIVIILFIISGSFMKL